METTVYNPYTSKNKHLSKHECIIEMYGQIW